jgi:hypothetical protein
MLRGDRWIGAHLSLEEDGRVHFHHMGELRTHLRADRDARFLELAEAYDASPEDFVAAWSYLSEHPIFHRPVHSGGRDQVVADLTADELTSPPEFVDDCDGLRDMWMQVSRIDGQVVVSLEHGPHVWPHDVPSSQHWSLPANGISSHDPDLDVRAESYESAVVALAESVRRCYGHDRSRITSPAETASE